MSTTNRTLVSLFTGAGGLDIGLERAGFRTMAATDHDDVCCETLTASRDSKIECRDGHAFLSGAQVIHADVTTLDPEELWPGLAAGSPPPDLMAGGPPCQPFSSAGNQLSVHDPRGLLFEHFVRLAAEIRPRYILFENVRGLVTARGHDGVHGGALATVLSAFSRIGYATSVSLMNSADFGSPQRRVRLFVIAARVWPLPVFPSPTHADLPAGAVLDERRPWVTLGEFLRTQPEPDGDDIVRPTPALAQQLKNVADGSGLRSAGARETTRPGGHWGYRQGTFIADQAAPARTVTAASTQDWIRTDRGLRRLTWRECAGLQGFPRDWVFWGPKAARFRQIGNAVPAVFGEVLGHALMTAMDQADDRRVPESRALPKELVAAIDYTKRDHSRNGASREFAKSALAHQPASVVKGLGSAEQGQRKRHRTQAQSPANPLFSDL